MKYFLFTFLDILIFKPGNYFTQTDDCCDLPTSVENHLDSLMYPTCEEDSETDKYNKTKN